MLPNREQPSRIPRTLLMAPLLGASLVIVFGLIVVFLGLMLEGPDGNRLSPGGMFLLLAGAAGCPRYLQILTGRVIMRESYWSRTMKWGDKQEHPVRYWITTVMYVVCSVVLFAYSIAIFAFTMDVIGAR